MMVGSQEKPLFMTKYQKKANDSMDCCAISGVYFQSNAAGTLSSLALIPETSELEMSPALLSGSRLMLSAWELSALPVRWRGCVSAELPR